MDVEKGYTGSDEEISDSVDSDDIYTWYTPYVEANDESESECWDTDDGHEEVKDIDVKPVTKPPPPVEVKKAPEPSPPPPPPPPPPAKKGDSAPFVINHEGKWMMYWDLLQFVVIVAVTIVVPPRIGFLIMEWIPWIAFDIFVQIIFTVDIFVRSFATYEDDGVLVKQRSMIMMRYLRGWLIPDIISVIPLEIFIVFIGSYTPLCRFNTLLRIGHLVNYFIQWEKVSSLKPSVVRIFKSTFTILILSHFIGCIFFLVILLEEENATPGFIGTSDITEHSFAGRYIRSFYWSFVIMTAYISNNPSTFFEILFSIIVSVIGISIFATIIGTVGSLVTNLDSSKLYFRQKMDGINDYMKYKRIPPELMTEVLDYYHYLWKSGKGLDQNTVMDDLPQYLKNRMSVYLNKEIITKVPMFSMFKDDEEFISEIVKCLKSRISLPNSFVVKKGEIGTEMYFISRGELNVVSESENSKEPGKVVFTLTDGGFFGEIALIYETKRTASIVARTYCDMFILTKEDFNNVKDKFPLQVEAIEKEAAERRKANSEPKKEAAVQPKPPNEETSNDNNRVSKEPAS